MTLELFFQEPWKTSHPAYENCAFNIRPAPEYATAEVVVASVYRAIGFGSYPERIVPQAGKDFDKASRKPSETTSISTSAWLSVLHGVLESPKPPNQSTRRFLQLCPVVPNVALYSGSARTVGNSWNPGSLIQRMICLGSSSRRMAEQLWEELFAALSVTEGDDIWARWLQAEFERRGRSPPIWSIQSLEQVEDLPPGEKSALDCPAKQFVRDLASIISAKDSMTRRQWTSLLESVLRLGAVTHVLWLCNVNDKLWSMVRNVLSGNKVPDAQVIEASLLSSPSTYLVYGNPAVPIIRDAASRYLEARLGINQTLWTLEKCGETIPNISSCSDIHSFLLAVEKHRPEFQESAFFEGLNSVRDDQARFLACKKGIGSNLIEFGQHVLGQRRTLNENLRGFDQGYILRKSGQYSAAPWVVSLGPVAVLALVHCCLNEVAGPRSVERLCMHLARYGLSVDRDDIAKSDLGQKLRMLGLILDSPDAESGMLLVPPFAVSRELEDRR